MADLYKILHILIVPMNNLEEHEKGMTNCKEKESVVSVGGQGSNR